ncbi:hypothetical protein FQN54_008846 [Arachnomyces sp. PD_36]|nr:hypothetical protein FQN54_008846 [Arachnomyces sp. PD_36]
MGFLSTTSASLLLLASTAAAFPHAVRDQQQQRNYSSLSWSKCDLPGFDYSKVEVPIHCANLDVPLDYTHPEDGDLSLQLIKVNATKEPVLGSILFNPGGPGGSGVEDVAQKGHIYDEILGGQYDLIGFDPRGVGQTLPFICGLNWTEAPSAQQSHIQRRKEVVDQDIAEIFKSTGWDDAKFTAEGCYQAQQQNGSYLSTAFVARDMLEIVDALGEDGMLRFWGQSYGTYLGQTFAAMFPDRIDRMVLDSVVDAPDYAKG